MTSRKRTWSQYQQMAMQSVPCRVYMPNSLLWNWPGQDDRHHNWAQLPGIAQISKDVLLGRFLKEKWLYLQQTFCGIPSVLVESCQMFLASMTRNELLKFPNVKLWGTYLQRCHSYKRSGDSRCIKDSQGKSPCQKWHYDIREQQFRGNNCRKKKVAFVRLNENELWPRI